MKSAIRSLKDLKKELFSVKECIKMNRKIVVEANAMLKKFLKKTPKNQLVKLFQQM